MPDPGTIFSLKLYEINKQCHRSKYKSLKDKFYNILEIIQD